MIWTCTILILLRNVTPSVCGAVTLKVWKVPSFRTTKLNHNSWKENKIQPKVQNFDILTSDPMIDNCRLLFLSSAEQMNQVEKGKVCHFCFCAHLTLSQPCNFGTRLERVELGFYSDWLYKIHFWHSADINCNWNFYLCTGISTGQLIGRNWCHLQW